MALPALDSFAQSFLATAPPVMVCSPALPLGVIWYVNAAFEQLTGCAAPAVVGDTPAFLLGPTPDPASLAQLHTAWETADPVPFTLQHLQPDGSPRWYALRLAPWPASADLPAARLVWLTDLTPQQQLEAALTAQQTLTHNLRNITRALTANPDLEVTLNEALNTASQLTDADRGSLFLLDPEGYVTHSLMSRGRVAPAEYKRLLREVMDKGLAGWLLRERQAVLIADTRTDDRWLTLADQPYKARSVLGVPILSGTHTVALLILQHAEPAHFTTAHLQNLQTAAEQMALALRNAQINDAQRRLAERQTTLYEILRVLGQELKPEVVARRAVETVARFKRWPTVALFVAEDDGQVLRCLASTPPDVLTITSLAATQGILGRAFRTGRTQRVSHTQADADYVPLYATTQSELAVPLRRGERLLGVLNVESPVVDAFSDEDVYWAESLVEAIALSLDNARLYADSLATAARLRELDRLKSAFLANMSHELRTPLLAISGYAEILLEETRARQLPTLTADVLRIEKAARHLTALINDVLDLSKLEAGRMELHRDLVDVPTLLDNVTATVHSLVEKGGNTLTMQVPPGLPPLRADPMRLRQVLINLVGNAAKFTHRGQITLTVRASSGPPPQMLFEVHDTGIGIAPDILPHLFQDFRQGDPSITRQYSGTGLGLALSRRLCRLMGGDIAVQSTLGAGSTFTVGLPLGNAQPSVNVTAQAQPATD